MPDYRANVDYGHAKCGAQIYSNTCHIVGMSVFGATENESVAMSISPAFKSLAQMADKSSRSSILDGGEISN